MWMLLDPEGTVGIVTDGSGNVVSYDQADLYGTTPTSNGSADASEFHWQCAFGYSYRAGANVYQVGERVYDPAQGRFLQQDPISDGEGDWTYADNDPAGEADPTGMEAVFTISHVVVAGQSHVGIVVEDTATGGVTDFRGEPGGPGGGWLFGSITVEWGPFKRSPDDIPGPWLPIVPGNTKPSGPTINCLKHVSIEINAKLIPYNPLGPNSNSVAYTLLKHCHLPLRKPGVAAPGWGTDLLH